MKHRLGRRLLTLVVLGLAAVGAWALPRLVHDPEVAARNRSLQSDLERIQGRNRWLRHEIGRLRGEIARLRADEDALLGIARTELGLVQPGEVVYQVAEVAEPVPEVPPEVEEERP
jgi:cell division protein FtsB